MLLKLLKASVSKKRSHLLILHSLIAIGDKITKKKEHETWSLTHSRWLQLMHLTLFVLSVGVGSTLEQLQGTQSLSSIGSTVQRRVAQQISAVDIRRFLLAELQQTHNKNR